MAVLRDTDCRECVAGRPHCHGTLIRHPDGHQQCTEPDCSHPELLMHSFLVDCGTLGCECADDDRHRLAV